MKNRSLFGAMFVFGAMVGLTGPLAAQATHDRGELVAATAETAEGLVQSQKPKEQEDPNAKFLVYTGTSGKVAGLKFYEFDQERRTHQKAIEFCEAKGLRLMSLDEADGLREEFLADKTKKATWLGEKKRSIVWTSSVYAGNPSAAHNIYVADSDDLYAYDFILSRDDHNSIGRCVAH